MGPEREVSFFRSARAFACVVVGDMHFVGRKYLLLFG
jgi:hypothetical protein